MGLLIEPYTSWQYLFRCPAPPEMKSHVRGVLREWCYYFFLLLTVLGGFCQR